LKIDIISLPAFRFELPVARPRLDFEMRGACLKLCHPPAVFRGVPEFF
jgi:hypothetical protein